MKRLFVVLYVLAFLFLLAGCAYNGMDENYENTDMNNESEDLYEEEMGDPEVFQSSIDQQNYMIVWNINNINKDVSTMA